LIWLAGPMAQPSGIVRSKETRRLPGSPAMADGPDFQKEASGGKESRWTYLTGWFLIAVVLVILHFVSKYYGFR
jgi:hypothetical protein